MYRAAISGIGVEIPEASITNDELVASFNSWVDTENAVRAGVRRAAAAEIEHRLHPLRLGRQGTPRAGARRHSRPRADGAAHSAARRFRALRHGRVRREVGQARARPCRARGRRHRHGDLRGLASPAALSGDRHRDPGCARHAGRGLRHGARLLVGGGRPACRLQPGAHRRPEARARGDAGDHHRAPQFPRPADAFHLRRRLDRDGRAGGSTRARRCPAASRSSTRAAGRSSPTTSAPISASSTAPARTTRRSW